MKWLYWAIRRTWSIARKEYVHILMDPGALFLTVFAPAVVLTLLAYIFTFDVGESDLAVVDMDQTPVSEEYVRTLSSDGYVNIVGYPRSYDEAVVYLEKGRADAALIIPPGFGATLSSGGYAPVHNVVDGIDAPAARQVMGAIEQRTHLFAERMGASSAVQPVDVRTRVWFNENLSSQYSMIPGLMSLVLILPAMAVALGITREKETGTLETLATTPVLASDVLAGKLFVYLTLGLLSALLALAVAIFWFGVPFRGSLLLWLAATTAYLGACMGFSLVVANFTRSQQTAMVIILLALFMPGFLMSGLSDPVDPTATASLVASYLLPTTHYITLSRAIALKGLGFVHFWREMLALVAMGVVGTVVAVSLFRKKIA
jgi:ABC-2 type transport system permease protein